MKIFVVAVAILLLGACQTNRGHRPDYQSFIQAEQLVKKSRVQRFRFQGWQPLDDRYLILKSSQRTSYLVRLMSSCNELPYAHSIQLKQDFESTLNAKFDSIIVPGQFNQECTIHSLYEMNKEQKAALLDFVNQKEENRP
ncbi:DUF6491 family protein [Marinicella litoralis]|uniref:Lipoprotein n=1 Tax=Marinicella litoralis TaxID=644220 RepID=A0A4R6XY59_9GAMM|nr:DUF6491 family protein [Marinicella litoralis]TDR23440.1 hypothetical protein C8D91_0301 [Marinicella litoralis]